MYMRKSIRNFRTGKNVPCKCSHPPLTHYTKSGECVVPGCGCREYHTVGRQKMQSKRARCEFGHSHDSGTEIKVCFELYQRKLAGDIKDYQAQKVLDLIGPSGKIVAHYKVDFVVDHHDGSTEYVEAKGAHLMNEGQWPLKWALLQDMHRGNPMIKFELVVG